MSRLLCILVLVLYSISSGAQLKPRWDTAFFTGENAPELLVLDSGYVSMVQHNDSVNRLQIRELDFQGNLVRDRRHDFNAQIENCGNCLERISPNRFIYGHTLFYRTDSSNIQLNQTYGFQLINNKILMTGYVYPDTQPLSPPAGLFGYQL